jgi:hypothetical protein
MLWLALMGDCSSRLGRKISKPAYTVMRSVTVDELSLVVDEVESRMLRGVDHRKVTW